MKAITLGEIVEYGLYPEDPEAAWGDDPMEAHSTWCLVQPRPVDVYESRHRTVLAAADFKPEVRVN